MEKKIDKLRELMAQENWVKALAMAARFPRLGDAKTAIERAHGMLTNPAFYKQLGFDEQATVSAGITALKVRYDRKE